MKRNNPQEEGQVPRDSPPSHNFPDNYRKNQELFTIIYFFFSYLIFIFKFMVQSFEKKKNQRIQKHFSRIDIVQLFLLLLLHSFFLSFFSLEEKKWDEESCGAKKMFL